MILPDAVAFDCDGTIADTESLSAIAWAEVLRSRGLVWTDEDFRALVGRPFAANWLHFRARGDLGDEQTFRSDLRGRFRELFEDRLEVHDDVVGAMRALAQRGVPMAVVSSSGRAHIERVLVRAGVTGLVAHIVASGDTEEHKPDPAPYLAACVALGVDPQRTVGVEDTTTGARSARAAGLHTVVVRRAHAVEELHMHAHVVVDDLRVDDLLLPGPSERLATAPAEGSGPPG
jgi:HAD superfamily hydrolase (TIGR01509 family)